MRVNNFRDIVNVLLGLSRTIVYLIMALAVMFFMWGLIGYIKSSGDMSAREESRKYMIYGILGLFVMVGMWGLVEILTNTFGFSGIGIPQIRI